MASDFTAENEQDEASHIADVIGQHLKEGGHLADHAILYRMNAQSAPIESYFTRAGIPHKIVGGQRFNDRKEVKDIHSYMSIVANPRDDVRLRRIINEPARKIGTTTIEVIADLAAQQGISMLDVISHADQYAKLSRAIAPLFKFWDIYQKLQESLETKTLDEFASDVIEITGYRAMLEADAAKGHEDAADRLQNLGQLVNNVKSYCDQHGEEASLEGYLEDIALISDIDSYNESADQVVLMTIHSAKGLEFPYVFLIGMEEGVFPSEMSKYSEADLEEERRLAYVGITRAKKELYISNSVTRMLYGRTQRNEPSRFLREIEPEYIEETRSPVLEQRSRMGGWGSEYSDTVPGGASGYSGPSGYSRSSYGGGYGSGYSSGNRSGFDPNTDCVADDQLQEIDRWALAALDDLIVNTSAGYAVYDFNKVYHAVYNFCVVAMSNFYLDVTKDRLYCTNGTTRKAAQTTMYKILVALDKIIAPILCFTSQEIWDFMPKTEGMNKYVVFEQMPKAGQYAADEAFKAKWAQLIAVRDEVKKVLEQARAEKLIGASLEASVTLYCSDAVYDLLNSIPMDELADLMIVSHVELVKGEGGAASAVEGLGVAAAHATGDKCERCWKYSADIGTHAAHPTLCARCAAVVEG